MSSTAGRLSNMLTSKTHPTESRHCNATETQATRARTLPVPAAHSSLHHGKSETPALAANAELTHPITYAFTRYCCQRTDRTIARRP